jgi:glucose dehydrogenase
MSRIQKIASVFVISLLWCGALATAQRPPARSGQWPYVAGDPGGMHYSPLSIINKSNVGRLKAVWTWKADEKLMPEKGVAPGSFEVSPLMIDGVL